MAILSFKFIHMQLRAIYQAICTLGNRKHFSWNGGHRPNHGDMQHLSSSVCPVVYMQAEYFQKDVKTSAGPEAIDPLVQADMFFLLSLQVHPESIGTVRAGSRTQTSARRHCQFFFSSCLSRHSPCRLIQSGLVQCMQVEAVKYRHVLDDTDHLPALELSAAIRRSAQLGTLLVSLFKSSEVRHAHRKLGLRYHCWRSPLALCRQRSPVIVLSACMTAHSDHLQNVFLCT
eukprot:1160176-Pelagomonas_calceolata.AAC.9